MTTMDDTLLQIIKANDARLVNIIQLFGGDESPDEELNEAAKKVCQDFKSDGGDPVSFLRDLRDRVAHTSGKKGFVTQAITGALAFYPNEDDEDMALRRANLAQAMGIPSTSVAPAPAAELP